MIFNIVPSNINGIARNRYKGLVPIIIPAIINVEPIDSALFAIVDHSGVSLTTPLQPKYSHITKYRIKTTSVSVFISAISELSVINMRVATTPKPDIARAINQEGSMVFGSPLLSVNLYPPPIHHEKLV
jgi:hypothetical protein